MILDENGEVVEKSACPHTRGDDPTKVRPEVVPNFLSPHAWG